VNGSEFVDVRFLDENVIALNERGEFVKCFGIVVFADSRIDALVPIVNAAEQVVTFDPAITHQGSAMQTSPIQYGNIVVVTNDN